MKLANAMLLAAFFAAPALHATIIYTTGFEASEGYTLGTLAGQNGWSGATVTAVGNSPAHTGSQVASANSPGSGQFLTGVPVSYSSIANPEQIANIEIFFMYQPGTGAVSWNPLAVFGENGFLGQIRISNGNIGLGLGSGLVGLTPLTPNAWHKIVFSFDFQTDTKSAFVDDALIASLPFGAVATGLSAVYIGQNSGASNTGNFAYWDDLTVSSVVAPVPEPGAMALTLAGIAAIASKYARRSSPRQSRRATGSPS